MNRVTERVLEGVREALSRDPLLAQSPEVAPDIGRAVELLQKYGGEIEIAKSDLVALGTLPGVFWAMGWVKLVKSAILATLNAAFNMGVVSARLGMLKGAKVANGESDNGNET